MRANRELENVAMTTIDLHTLKPNERNPRKITPDALRKLCESIERDPAFMELRPIIIDDDGMILGGNQRFSACQQLGMKNVPSTWVRTATGLTEEQRKRFIIVDNAPEGMAGEWDMEILATEWQMPELGDLGFDLDDLAASLPTNEDVDTEPQVDRAEDLRKEWGVESGQLWVLGDHRLLCGDSTKRADVARVLGGERPMVMITDPPYGVNLDQSWRDKALGDKAMGPGNRNVVQNDDRADWSEVWELFPGDVAYVWHADKFSDVVMASLRGAGFEICQQIIWNKSIMVMGRSDYHFKHEPCWYAVRKGKRHGWVGDRTQTTVIEAKSPNHIMSGSDEEKTAHPTQKPVECMSYLLKNHAGDVYEPFSGSGTTIIACEQLGRKCRAIELSPGYVAVALQRFKDATGKTPTLVVAK